MAVSRARSELYPSSSAFPAPGHEGVSYLYDSLYLAGIYGRGEINQTRGEITRWKGWCCESRRPEQS